MDACAIMLFASVFQPRCMRGRAHVGTAGWLHPHWQDVFYPEGLAPSHWLAYYAGRFGCVEISRTYHRLLEPEVAEAWLALVPDDFVFAVRGHRYITHARRLREPQGPLSRFLTSIEPLAPRVGVVLFQLPPDLAFDAPLLDAFLDALPHDPPYRYAVEFHHPSWDRRETYALLGRHDVAFCIHDFLREPVLEVTADPVYVRLYGPEAPSEGRYPLASLLEWHERVRAWLEAGRDVWCLFANDHGAFAPANAEELQDMLVQPPPPGARARA